MKRTATDRPLLRLAAFALLLAAAFAALLLTGRAKLTTDLFTLLPEEDRDPVLAAAIAQSRDAFFDRVDIVISARPEQREQAANAAAGVVATLKDSPLVLDIATEQHARLRAAYRDQAFQWLSAKDRAALLEAPESAFRQRVAASLARPGRFDTSDPAGLLDAWLATLPAPAADWTLVGDFPARVHDGELAIYLAGRLQRDPMSAQTQRELNVSMRQAETAMRASCASCTLYWTGAVRFSEATRQAAQADIERITTLATLGIVVLFVLAFRSVRPLFAALLVLGAGIAAGLAASLAVFGGVHVLTLVFGTTLLGLSVDYVLHFLVHRWAHPEHDARQALAAVRPGMLMGLVTSLTAFAFLLFAGFPALGQLAVFAATGMLTAFAMVCLWLPHTLAAPPAANPLERVTSRPSRFDARLRYALLAGIVLAALAGAPSLAIVDDVRGLQSVPDPLAKHDARVRSTLQGLPGHGGSDFHLVEGRTLDEALAREAVLFGNEGGFGLSRFLSTHETRERNLAAYAELFAGEPSAAQRVLAEFGFDASLGAALEQAFASVKAPPATEALLSEPGFAPLAPLHVRTGAGVTLISRPNVPLATSPAGVRHVEPLAEVQATFRAIRLRAIAAVGGAYLLMMLILSWRYGPRDAARVLAPALLGAGCAVGLLGLAGLPLNIFSLVSLVLVLGIGADYALFLREGSAWPKTARLATSLAALTSLLSFGLLVLSSLDALRAFGFAAGTGILTAWLAAPLALPKTAVRGEPATEEIHDRAA